MLFTSPFPVLQGLDGPTGEKGVSGAPGPIGLPGTMVRNGALQTEAPCVCESMQFP